MVAIGTSTIGVAALAVDVEKPIDTARGDRMIAAYFEHETRKLADKCLADVKSWDDFKAKLPTYRRQLREMLGLDPLPERFPLQPVVTGKVEHDLFTVENLHFQSRPHLYVTANLYLPKNQSGPAPAILYVCGHSKSVKNGVSYGNKTKYQHHGAWFARNGYVCLVIDTLQLGEIEGVHHGTYRENMWWWNARGYTPAGVEALNSIRALDYLESRPEVDARRIGVTGRSGGGAYSWYLAALDDRVKCLVPVAGITNLKNHVVDGCVEGHCDCMYTINTYRWDYPQIAAMAAPRQLLIANSDRDRIFPLDGVLDVHDKVKSLYGQAGKRNRLGLHVTVGPHEDTQVLQLHAFQWFNHHFKHDDRPVEGVAKSYFEPEQLKVFEALPADQINTRVHEVFVPPAAEVKLPSSIEEWRSLSTEWKKTLREKSFAGWPDAKEAIPNEPQLVFDAEADGVRLLAYDFESQHAITLRLYLAFPADIRPQKLDEISLRLMDEKAWMALRPALNDDFTDAFIDEQLFAIDKENQDDLRQKDSPRRGLAFVAPRGIGRSAWNADGLKQTHIRRRFMLLGQTLDGMRVWDARRAVQTLKSLHGLGNVPVSLVGDGEMAGIALYAALFEPSIESVELRDLPASHRAGPDFLNVLRILDMPQAVAMVAENTRVRIRQDGDGGWEFPKAVDDKFDWGRLEILPKPAVEK
jgi:cephalosporin-C deacetylase-like acetyl esterase